MNISHRELRKQTQQCQFIGCTQTFVGPAQQKYCRDARCIAARKTIAQRDRKPKIDENVDNLTLARGKFANGTMLRIQCSACGPTGRCQEKFLVIFESNRREYPKYCERHRNTYQRKRFEGKN